MASAEMATDALICLKWFHFEIAFDWLTACIHCGCSRRVGVVGTNEHVLLLIYYINQACFKGRLHLCYLFAWYGVWCMCVCLTYYIGQQDTYNILFEQKD